MLTKLSTKKQTFLAIAVLVFAFLFDSTTQAKTQTVRKVQEVNFSELNLKGTVRNPDGAYLVQKRGLKFMPLYNVQKDMDKKIRDAVDNVQ